MNNISNTDKRILITGGAGFIGSHLVRRFVTHYPHYHIVNYDALTYAGNLANLQDLNKPNHTFVKGDICDADKINTVLEHFNIDVIIHLAAESHVDRSITNPLAFVQTNVLGTANLLNCARKYWHKKIETGQKVIFYHVSTDEVYGTLGNTGFFTEQTPYDPHSPYSASKASSDHFVRAYHDTYGLPVLISNCSNNYGGYQFPEKLIPLTILNIIDQKPIPIYGKGENVRDWLYVEDHCAAIDLILHQGKTGETYNIGGENEMQNLDVARILCRILDKKLNRPEGANEKLIEFVTDRLGHDLRYAIDPHKLRSELNWRPSVNFEDGLELTVSWYLNNPDWVKNVKSGIYQQFTAEKTGLNYF